MILQKGGWSIVHYSVFFHHLQYQYEEKGPEIPVSFAVFFFKTNEMIYRKEQSL